MLTHEPERAEIERPGEPPPPAALGPEAEAVHRHARGVFRFLRVLGAPLAVADDLTQEAFVVAWKKHKQGLPAQALGAFLRRTAKLLWLGHVRSARREERALAAVADQLWARDCAADDGESLVAGMRDCLQRLGPRARTAIECVYGDEAHRDAVAQQLGLLPNGLKMLLQRARQQLLDCLRRNR